MWALVATFIKSATDTLSQFGIGGMFLHWPVYALAASGVAGMFLEQSALHTGPLRVSQPLMVIVDPVVSIALSVWLFGSASYLPLQPDKPVPRFTPAPETEVAELVGWGGRGAILLGRLAGATGRV